MTVGAYTRAAAERLESAGFAPDEARRDIGVIARAILGWDQARWLVQQTERAPAGFRDALEIATGRRLAREPVAYIVGEREFYGRRFSVTPAVLIPRPETELVVEGTLAIVGGPLRTTSSPSLLDVGTGSGCICITLALESPHARVVGHDISQAALDVARRNAEQWNVASRVDLRLTPLAGDESEAFDVIAANPPYVALADRETLQPDVRDFEPETALYGGEDGLGVIRPLLPSASNALKQGGYLVMEIGAGQAGTVADAIEMTSRLTLQRVIQDLAGISRVIVAKKDR